MKKKSFDLRTLTVLSLYAALIFLSIQVFRIPIGPQFIHFGNALVLVGLLLFGAGPGLLAAAVGLAIFDILNGYAAVAWITVLESGIVALVVYLVFEKILRKKDSLPIIAGIAVLGAATKIVVNLVKYTITGVMGANLTWDASFVLAAGKILGTFGSALATIIAVPLLYPIFKRLLQEFRK